LQFIVLTFGALQGQADREVLDVFRNAYEEVRRGYNDALIQERKTNLAALLLDVANKEGDPSKQPSCASICSPTRDI
jgi:hypothetical protein